MHAVRHSHPETAVVLAGTLGPMRADFAVWDFRRLYVSERSWYLDASCHVGIDHPVFNFNEWAWLLAHK